MKISEVPQDQNPSFEGGTKLCYALDENGQFVPVKTSGWNIESAATDLAWKAIQLDLEETKNKVLRDQASPLEYFMKLRQMDLGLLAENMGFFRLRVWWHLRPQNFHKLNFDLRQKYADCLKVSVEDFHALKELQ